MTTQTHAQQAAAVGVPTVGLPWGHGTHVRRSDHSTVLSTGEPIPLQTDAPESALALATLGGWWPWHRLCQAIRVPVLTGLPDGITAEDLGDGRWLVTGPAGGRMIVQRISRSR